jgi:hypothetical protein
MFAEVVIGASRGGAYAVAESGISASCGIAFGVKSP